MTWQKYIEKYEGEDAGKSGIIGQGEPLAGEKEPAQINICMI